MLLAALTPPGGGEMIVILLIFVLLFGAKKLPELGSSLGAGLRNLKRGLQEVDVEDAGSRPRGDQTDGSESDRANVKRPNAGAG
jgi:sec-independent protein translocase protein TatA